MEFHFLTLFPEVFESILSSSLLGKAQKKGLVSYYLTQIRDFSVDKHRSVDDAPYGGGEGMVLRADVLYAAWESVRSKSQEPPESPESLKSPKSPKSPKSEEKKNLNTEPQKTATLLMSPQGQLLDQQKVRDLATYSKLILVCGHYEGVDERFIELCVDQEISIGDYVLTGGELPALVVADAVTRLLPGVVGNEKSISQDSLEKDLLKYPQYTRPREFRGLSVPDVLLSGHHETIHQWREKEMHRRTEVKRPDLWERFLRVRGSLFD